MTKKLLFFLLALTFNTAWAQIPKPQKNSYVDDFAHVLSKADVDDLNDKIAEMDKALGVQMAIVLVEKIPDGYTIKSFSTAIGQEWQVGDNQSGLVYVAAIKQHQQRIEVARNLDSVFTSEKCAAILDAMKPWFKNKNYAGGLELLVGQIADGYNSPAPVTVTSPAKIVQQPQPQTPPEGREDWPVTILVLLFLLAVGIGIFKLFAAVIKNQRNSGNSRPSMPGYTGRPVNRSYGHSSSAGSFIAGAAVGAATAYAASKMQDNLSDNSDSDDSSSYADNSDDDDDSRSGSSWGSSDDSGSSNDSSSYDSGFSDSGSSDSGATSDW
ncbi:TPM domain-containing protein [Mucilaginibacter paludis]|uniref:TPM domain-containing protein n=1 Tax=Mucilaginibacter paludis DSM 18603 TaxID=714943 RepID=H1Y3R4_9SPHI|nr:TPM domain-containing protein [Mucilaginibacter paludis]EHQ30326.1 protein of unknown function DUF477 [Mucilaginibacter paludis DSM 18603]